MNHLLNGDGGAMPGERHYGMRIILASISLGRSEGDRGGWLNSDGWTHALARVVVYEAI
jgi:hypothetical protein